MASFVPFQHGSGSGSTSHNFLVNFANAMPAKRARTVLVEKGGILMWSRVT
jgi:hypothetical protein